MQLKQIAAGAAMVGALGLSAVGLSAGVANAAPSTPVVTGVQWQQDSGNWGNWSRDGSGSNDRRAAGNHGGSSYPPAWGCITGTITWCP